MRNSGMTIMELMVSMAVFSLIMISVLVSVQSMTVARIKSMNRIALIEQLYFFSEQFFTEIKNGGTIDYEEYWNRRALGSQMSSGHYRDPSGVGNYGKDGNVNSLLNNHVFGDEPYLCRSEENESM